MLGKGKEKKPHKDFKTGILVLQQIEIEVKKRN